MYNIYNKIMKAFLNIKTEPGVCRRRESKPGYFVDYAYNTHQVCIGIEYEKDYGKWYMDNSAWFMGSFFIQNPFYKTMTLKDFKKLLGKIALKLDFDKEGKKYFKGNCEELMGKITKFMDRLMDVLNVHSDVQGEKWSYKECPYASHKLKEKFKSLDNFMKK